MKISRIVAIIVLCLSLSWGARAQYYTLGADPASVRWSILQTDHYRVIYPLGQDSLARSFLYNFEVEYPRTQVALKIKPYEMPMVLHPYALRSNATVAWSPRRVDIFTTPPFNSGFADDWAHTLATHEGRHVGQVTHFTTGTFKVFRYILGEQAVAIGQGFYPAMWEQEGDAVHSETDFSKAGRGRDPNFLMGFKASLLSGEDHTYDGYRFGSVRNNIPGKYPFGYLVETFMRDNGD